ncbi:MAG: alpha/beta fold hydrolase [Rhodoferax sp.]|nr:alpha/beta fold hydrolase [Rhodoferax sp.]
MTARTSIPGLTATVLRLAMLALALYGAVLGWLWFNQEKLLFVPTVLPVDRPLAQAPDIHELNIDVPGARLSALHLQLPNPKGVVFFLHGNGGSLESWFVNADFYRRANFDLVMFDYRGYGKSTGQIESEAQLRQDVRTAWATVAPRYAGKKVVFCGRSLGSGLAAGLSVELAKRGAPNLTVLVSPTAAWQRCRATTTLGSLRWYCATRCGPISWWGASTTPCC